MRRILQIQSAVAVLWVIGYIGNIQGQAQSTENIWVELRPWVIVYQENPEQKINNLKIYVDIPDTVVTESYLLEKSIKEFHVSVPSAFLQDGKEVIIGDVGLVANKSNKTALPIGETTIYIERGVDTHKFNGITNYELDVSLCLIIPFDFEKLFPVDPDYPSQRLTRQVVPVTFNGILRLGYARYDSPFWNTPDRVENVEFSSTIEVEMYRADTPIPSLQAKIEPMTEEIEVGWVGGEGSFLYSTLSSFPFRLILPGTNPKIGN